MARQKIKVPKKVAGIKIRKRHRKQLRSLAEQIDRVEELVVAGSAILAMLGLAHKIGGKGDKPRGRGKQASTLAH
jgi:RNase P/RNase MRP subunit p30